MDGFTCAELETAINIAAANAIYDHSEVIQKEHLTHALMQILFNATLPDKEYTPEEWRYFAVHEASHAIVSEILIPGSVAVVSLLSSENSNTGLTAYYNLGYSEGQDLMNMVTFFLAGKAGVEVILGRFDIGTESDLADSYNTLAQWVTQLAGGGFQSVEQSNSSTSENGLYQHEQLITAKLDELYTDAKRIVFDNRDRIERLSAALLKEKILLNSDVRKIIEDVGN